MFPSGRRQAIAISTKSVATAMAAIRHPQPSAPSSTVPILLSFYLKYLFVFYYTATYPIMLSAGYYHNHHHSRIPLSLAVNGGDH
jgi:hypothetical protein